MKKRMTVLAFLLFSLTTFAQAQRADVTIQLNEQFFDALLDAVFKNSNPPEFPLAENNPKSADESAKSSVFSNSFAKTENRKPKTENRNCTESIKLQREIDGVRTAVRFREGKIYVPLAFTGNYNPPLIGCVDFAGVAETNIDLEFDENKQALIGRARVLNVNLSGTGGIGGNLLARLVQSSIDKKINPIQILQMDKISFVVPIQNAGSLKMKAIAVRPEISNAVLNVRITYELLKAE